MFSFLCFYITTNTTTGKSQHSSFYHLNRKGTGDWLLLFLDDRRAQAGFGPLLKNTGIGGNVHNLHKKKVRIVEARFTLI